MITKINLSEIVYIESNRRLTGMLLEEIKHIHDIHANPIFESNIILEHIIDTVDIAILDAINNHKLI